MPEVAYLLGAVASAQCMPVVNGMEEGIGKLVKELQPIGLNKIYGDERAHLFSKRARYYCTAGHSLKSIT